MYNKYIPGCNFAISRKERFFMFPAQDSLPTPIGTLDSLLEDGDTSAKPHKVFIAHNLGNRAFLMSVPMHDFHSMSAVANERGVNGEPVAQRKLTKIMPISWRPSY